MTNCQEIIDYLKTYFTIKTDELHYNITSSNYNPTIDNTVTITVTVTDGNNDPVTSHTFTLDANGTDVSLTTNSSGVATYTYTCNTWGACRFSVETYTLFINVGGFKQVKTTTVSSKITYTLYVDESTRTAQLRVSGSDFSIQSGNENYTSSSFIPSSYRPAQNIFSFVQRSQYIFLYAWSNGNCGLVNWNSSTLTGQQCSVLVEWHY